MNILYATDGSEGALTAGRFLSRLAPPPHEPPVRVHILTVQRAGETNTGDAAAADVLPAARDALGDFPESVTQETREGAGTGHAAQQILSAAEALPADLILVGTHGRSAIARLLLGSVAERVARYAPCSVLVARPFPEGQTAKEPIRRVVVGIDGSGHAENAARWLTRFLPLPPDCVIQLTSVLTPVDQLARTAVRMPAAVAAQMAAAMEQEREEARSGIARAADALSAETGLSVETAIVSGDPPSSLIDAAEGSGADLLVVGAQGLTGLDRFLLGSVSDRVLRHAPCSVLVVKVETSGEGQPA